MKEQAVLTSGGFLCRQFMAIGLGFSLHFFFTFSMSLLPFHSNIESIRIKTFLFPLTSGQCCPVQVLL